MITPREIVAAALLLVVAALVAVTPAHAARAGLAPVGDPAFPDRAYVLTLPAGVTPSPDQIVVSEDRVPVTSLEAGPYGARSDFGVVLVIDASHSMRGAPIRDAMAAARAFAAQRPAAQRIGVVSFNGATETLLEPAADDAQIDAALAATPRLASGTKLYDAAASGIDLLTRSGSQAGAIVLLSDGADSGSVASARSVAAAATQANARVFTIGVRSRSYDGATLEQLARSTQGEYLGAATGKSLRSLYRELGGQLANAYLLRYRSQAPAGARVSVEARAAGLKARTSYSVPALTTSTADGAREQQFLATVPGIVLVTAVTLVAVFLVLLNLLGGRGGKLSLRERVGAYGDVDVSTVDSPARKDLLGRFAGGQRLAGLAEMLELAGIGLAPRRLVALVGLGGLLLGWCLAAVVGSWLLVPVGLLICFLVARALIRARVARQRAQFADELADSLQAVASAMRAGHSFAGALSVMSEEAADRTAIEFGRVIADERLGVPLEDALADTIRRMDNRDLEQVALVAVLQRETGGNGAEALDRVVENLRAREEVRRLVRALTAQGQLSRWVLTALPIVVLLFIAVVSPGYAEPLWQTTLGNVLVVTGALLVAAGSMVINRIVKIEV